jgi:hypothetical protein
MGKRIKARSALIKKGGSNDQKNLKNFILPFNCKKQGTQDVYGTTV